MILFLILAIGIIIAFVIYMSKKKSDSVNSNTECTKSINPIELWGITEPVTDHEEFYDTWTTNVAGTSLRCSTKDVGGIVGYVDAEPTNTYNSHAMAVYLHTDRHIGYIYDSELEDYRSWSRCKKLPFVGYIQPSENGVSARIHIIVPKSREFLIERAGRFYIPIKEDGKIFLIPNIKDMIVPNREETPKYSDLDSQNQPILEDDESYTFPALRKKEFLFVVVNEKLIDREHELIGKIYNLIQEISQQDDFVKEVKAIIPATYEVDPAFVFLIGDITTCIHEIGGDADAYSPHGIALIMAVNKITNHDELSDNISLMAISDENMQLYRDISSGFNSACHSISGYQTFIISSILNNIDSPKYREYIDLMTKLTELLVEIKDKHPNKSQDFIKHLNAIKEDIMA